MFQRIAKEANYNKEIDPHEAYEEELEERHKRTLSGLNISNKKKKQTS
ncbi:hypothetical protein MUP42_04430 [Candidatus Bathyarchaeota archaeon]|nr:hypothetical protein [Candidatus Bathyarchaeota archaeon]